MPIYEYACPKCGQFEVTQRITDEPLKKCPTCKSKVRKLISNTSFQLKGSGWYATDYAGKKGAAKEAGGAAEDGGAKSGEGAEKPKESSGESAAKDSGSKSKDSSTSAKKDTSARAA